MRIKEKYKSFEDFYQAVYDVTQCVPSGRVTTYGAIAEFLSLVSAARFVGWALNAVHNQPDVPAHRVVNRNGLLSGKHHFGEPNRMQELLENEGIIINDNRVINFKELFWHPQEINKTEEQST